MVEPNERPVRYLSSILVLFLLLAGPATATQPWQQEINYTIDVTLVDSLRSVTGSARIQYINHSPDTLHAIWFRLPPAALRGGSGVDRFDFPEDTARFRRVDSDHWGNLIVGAASVDSEPAEFEQDFSIGLLKLETPLVPGDTAAIHLPFTTRFPVGRAASRIGYVSGQYKGVYWYPMICPYTPQYGWTVNRYFGTGEAYGEFGNFELRYTVPKRYIVASTGILVNSDDVLPPARLEGLSLDNPDPIAVPDGEEGEQPVTWIYRAEKVPDVAFAMDPQFLIDRVDFGHFESWSFIRRENREGWVGVAQLCGWTIEQLEGMYGTYPWPRVVATDSWSAMEYPMLTQMSGPLKGREYIFIHEVVHNYTPMIIHSNSVDAQALDEGFTTFVEHVLTTRYFDSEYNRTQTVTNGLLSKKFTTQNSIVRGKRPYLESVLAGEDLPMVRGGDIAKDYTLLRASTYYKMPVLLNALRYTIGEEAFWAGMRQYYSDYALTHPDELDMIESFEKGSGQPLGWFFKQFLYSSDDIDYSVDDFEVSREGKGWRIQLVVSRHQGVRLPLRLGLINASGDTLFGEIPFLVTDPPVPGYERWGSWDQLHEPRSSFPIERVIKSGSKPRKLIVDPHNQLADRNPLNNSSGRSPIQLRYRDGFLPELQPPVDAYEIAVGPRVGWNERWGGMPGIRIRGGYMDRVDRFDAELFTPVSQGFSPVQARFWGATPLPNTTDGFETTLYTGLMHGDQWLEGGIRTKWRTWGNRTHHHHAAFQFGNWERQSPWPTEQQVSVPYFHMAYRVESPHGVDPGTSLYTISLGEHRGGFAVFTGERTVRTRVRKKWTTSVESRIKASTANTPALFSSTLNSIAPYQVLGDPVLGGVLNKPGDYEPGGKIYLSGPAVLSSYSELPADQFIAWTISQIRGWGAGAPTNILERLRSRIRTGFYHAGALFMVGELGSRTSRTGMVFEVGVEAGLEDFYGLDLKARSAPLSFLTGEAVIGEQTHIPNSQEEWKRSFNVFVRYRVNRLFR